MPKFLYWCLPLVLLFDASIFLGFSNKTIVFTFFMAFAGLFVELIRSIVIAKDTPINKRKREKLNYY
jgi:hypothetical protein